MDRRRRRARALGLALALAASAGLAAEAPPPLRAMRWIAPDADAGAIFATAPTECLRTPVDARRAAAVETGRAAFRTPVLLGGQAARAGLSCESCHRSGRGNPEFLFPGASGAPGTADVTLSLFSSRRGNGVHDPRPIPDLSGPRERLKIPAADLPAFIHGLIIEEFDGAEPPPAVLAGLAAYVAALDPAACPAAAREPVSVATLMDDARRALAAARTALTAPDPPTAVLMVAAARARLGLIDERYADQPALRTRLRRADASLSDLQAAIRAGRPGALSDLDGWLGKSRDLQRALRRGEPASLFNPDRLSQAANRRLPPKAS